MNLRAKLGRAVAVLALAGWPVRAGAQDPVQRVANIVSVAVEEYKKGIDGQGKLLSADEYRESVGFLNDARVAAARLPRERIAAAGPLLDSIVAGVAARKPPAVLDSLAGRFAKALGSEAALALPKKSLALADGRRLYDENCFSCQGPRGLGDGPAAKGLTPPPAP